MPPKTIFRRPVVTRSISSDEGLRCVDIFRRKDNRFGFEEYRKDPENIDGWYNVGYYSDKIYKNQKEAYKNACKNILWLKYKK